MAPKKPSSGVDFLALHSAVYSGRFVLPEGQYALFFETTLQQPKEGSAFTKERLGVKVLAYPLDKPGAEPMEQFYSMGSKAHLSFLPSDDAKGLQPVVGGPGTITNKSNWFVFFRELYNAGLPEDLATNDLSILDGIWVQTGQIPEPEERSSFQSDTAEVQTQTNRTPGKIAVVTEILDGGKPWEGGGGMPEAKGKKAAPATKAKVAPKAAVVEDEEEAEETTEEGDDAVRDAAINAVAEILGESPKGVPKLILKTKAARVIQEKNDKATSEAAIKKFFANDAALADFLGQLDYVISGTQVKPKA